MVEPTSHTFASLAEELGFWKEQSEAHQQRYQHETFTLRTRSSLGYFETGI